MQSRAFGIFGAATAMIAVGTGVTISAELVDYPVFAAQALRYAVAAAILVTGVLVLRRRMPIPRGRANRRWGTALRRRSLSFDPTDRRTP